ncbi:uncharacterized protein LOC129586612 [Paramacrobiotus metropolitanus]|uniref:uncharacterized protein LOC129586612 n=1 Tax=Paramacrobiotus metropolitanus TaxID=2943436 RepID=UPI0024460881|nr:uncharacterized protein LOC129586612 [Paramacrobiotus metropolitanus]
MWNARDSQAIMVKKFPLWKELEKADILQPEAQLRFVLGWDVARTCSESGRYQEAWELYRDMIVCVRNVSPKYSFYRAQFLREASACVLNWGTEFIGGNKEQKKRLLPLLLDAVPLAIELMKDALDTYSTLCKKSVVTGRIASWLLLQEKLQALVLEFSEKSPMQTAK